MGKTPPSSQVVVLLNKAHIPSQSKLCLEYWLFEPPVAKNGVCSNKAVVGLWSPSSRKEFLRCFMVYSSSPEKDSWAERVALWLREACDYMLSAHGEGTCREYLHKSIFNFLLIKLLFGMSG